MKSKVMGSASSLVSITAARLVDTRQRNMDIVF